MQMPEKNKLLKIFFIVILFLAFFIIGSFKLDAVPALNQDEMTFALGTDIFSNTGYDLCGNKLPLFPCNAKEWPYGGQTISYYANALFYKFYTPGGISGIRIFSVLIGALTGIFALLFFYKILRGVKNGFACAAILSVIFYFSPVIFTIQRFAAVYLILSALMQMILFYLIYEFHRTNKKILLFFIPLTASLLMLDYQIYRFFAPFYLFLFIFLFRQEIFSARGGSAIGGTITKKIEKNPVTAESFYKNDINNLKPLAKIKFILFENKYLFAGLSIFTAISLIIINQIINDKFTTEYYFTNNQSFSLIKLLADFLFHFSTIPFYFYYNLNYFFFFNDFGLFPFLSVIFFIFGLAWILKNFRQNNFLKFILVSFLFYPVASALLGINRFTSNRIINLIPVYFIILIYGVRLFRLFADHLRKKLPDAKLSQLLLSPLFWLAIIVFQNFYFIYDYFYKIPLRLNFCQFNSEHGRNCNFTELFDYLKNETKNYDKIYLDEDLLFIDSYAKFFNKITRYGINNYETVNYESQNNLTKNSAFVTSKTKAEKLNLEKKYKLIKIIDEPNSQKKFFYIFLIEKTN